LPQLPIALVRNGIDVEHFAPGPGDGRRLDELAALPPAGPDTLRVGLVATYARWKGQDVFLQAAARLAREALPVRFYLVGGPVYQTVGSQWTEAELRRQAADLLAGRRLGFLGFQQDTAAVYRALDVVVHASTQPEPFGLTIAEAMACARPVVVARAGGAAELFTGDHDAVGVPPGDAAALAAALRDLAADPARRQFLGDNARRTAVLHFHRDRLGGQVLAAYAGFRGRGVTSCSAFRDPLLPPAS
jgi:glycosyltransferase involved in cell wall biosynthesis